MEASLPLLPTAHCSFWTPWRDLACRTPSGTLWHWDLSSACCVLLLDGETLNDLEFRRGCLSHCDQGATSVHGFLDPKRTVLSTEVYHLIPFLGFSRSTWRGNPSSLSLVGRTGASAQHKVSDHSLTGVRIHCPYCIVFSSIQPS